ncbi:MAG: PilZ domain-containing protein [Desulfobacterales bacterium]|jgi:Tfp pilus assembly protein PilZ
MLDSDPHLGKYGITARLFKLIDDMSKDKKLILLKQLIGDDVAAQLCKLIVDMSEDQQIILLEQLEAMPAMEMPETTVSLEGNESSMRENTRKPCLINAKYRIKNKDYKSYILDISVGGVFIETAETFTIGQKIGLNFTLPTYSKPFKLIGTITWGSPRGFGVKFDKVPAPESEILKSFIEQEK